MLMKVVVSIFAIQYFLFCYREGSVAECYLLCTFCFLQGQFQNMWRLLNGKNNVILSQFFYRKIIICCVVYCIVLHRLRSPVDRTICVQLTSSSWLFSEMFSCKPLMVANNSSCGAGDLGLTGDTSGAKQW